MFMFCSRLVKRKRTPADPGEFTADESKKMAKVDKVCKHQA